MSETARQNYTYLTYCERLGCYVIAGQCKSALLVEIFSEKCAVCVILYAV